MPQNRINRNPNGPRSSALPLPRPSGACCLGSIPQLLMVQSQLLKRNSASSPGALGITIAITLLGCAVGAWFAGQLSDIWGRKKVMVLAEALFVASSLGSGFAVSEGDLAAWRLLGQRGLTIGTASVIAPAYIGEVAPARLRGSLGSLQQLAIATGIFMALLSDAYLSGAAGSPLDELWFGIPAWRWMLLVGVVPAAVYGVLALSIPESPQFLLRQGRDEEARDVIKRVTGSPDPDT